MSITQIVNHISELKEKEAENAPGILDYFLVFLLVANSAFAFFHLYIEFKIINLFIVLFLFILRNKTINLFIIIYLILFTIIFTGQLITIRILDFQTYFSISIRILIAYLTIKLVSVRMFRAYINIIVLFALISFCFYFPCITVPAIKNFFINTVSPLFKPPFYDAMMDYYQQVIIFNFDSIDDFRNAGPFWEAGTFGGFLLIAIMLNTVMNGYLWEKKNIIMMFALLTTLSTTNYIAFFIFLIAYFLFIRKRDAIVILIPLTGILLLLFTNLSFMQDKITSQLNEVDRFYEEGEVGNRFVSAMVDIEDFMNYPLFGVYRLDNYNRPSIRFNQHRSNGLATHLAKFGGLFFMFYFYYMYLSLSRFTKLCGFKYLGLVYLLIVMLIGFSEEYYNTPFFYGLTMMHLLIPAKVEIEAKAEAEEEGKQIVAQV